MSEKRLENIEQIAEYEGTTMYDAVCGRDVVEFLVVAENVDAVDVGVITFRTLFAHATIAIAGSRITAVTTTATTTTAATC